MILQRSCRASSGPVALAPSRLRPRRRTSGEKNRTCWTKPTRTSGGAGTKLIGRALGSQPEPLLRDYSPEAAGAV